MNVWLKGENTLSRYWGFGDTPITILDTHGKLWCMTDHSYDCKHVKAVQTHLQQTTQ
jgi:hypothetical protein